MNAKVLAVVYCALVALSPSIAVGQTNVIFVNGATNTLEDARRSMHKLREVLDASPNHTGTAKRRFEVSFIWNPMGFTGAPGAIRGRLDDIEELFIFKTAEENFATYLPGLVCRHNDKPSLNRLSAATVVQQSLEDLTPGNNDLERRGVITDSDLELSKAVILSLVTSITEKRRAVVVAHSQGNLLANLAWFQLVANYGNGANNMMRLVNVGNPSLVSVHGLNFTHAGDIALSILRIIPEEFSLNRETARCNGICSFDIDTQTLPAVSGSDFFNHGFSNTYLGTATLPARDLGEYDHGVVESAGSRMVDRFEDFVYAAAQSLSYPMQLGAGDDLSVRFRLRNASGSTNALAIGLVPANYNGSTEYRSSLSLRDGSRLIGMNADHRSQAGLAAVFVTADSALSDLNPIAEFGSIRAGSIDGNVSFQLGQGSFAFDPRYSFGNNRTSSVDVVGEICWRVDGNNDSNEHSISCMRTQESAVRGISVNGARVWRPTSNSERTP